MITKQNFLSLTKEISGPYKPERSAKKAVIWLRSNMVRRTLAVESAVELRISLKPKRLENEESSEGSTL